MLSRKQSPRAVEQCQRGGPRRHVNQVDAHDRVGRLRRPRESGHVKLDGRIDVCQLSLPDAQCNGLAKFRIWIGRLPSEARERLGEMNDVLSRTAGYLQHNASGGQNARKNIEYRALVAL